MGADAVIAWVESPLQFIGAAEWAARERRSLPVAGRLTAQMSETADELIARGASLGELTPYLGIPWSLLARHRHWLVGDGFSGQFRLAVSVLRPKRLTFLDDGAHAIAFADSLLGERPYARPHVRERGLTARLAPLALESVLRSGRARSAEFFTAFRFGSERTDALADRGFAIERNEFAWTRASRRGDAPSARVAPDLGPRIVLGSARPVDDHLALADFVAWVAGVARHGEVTYLPHRREPAAQLEAIAGVPGVRVVETGLPVELVLAGTTVPLEIFTLPSSAITTLRLVLAGTGSRIRTRTASHEGADA